MTAYVNADLALTFSYPKEFVPRSLRDMQTVMDRGHRGLYGTEPGSDREHSEAVRCMHSLLYATADLAATDGVNGTPLSDDDSADTILVVDVDGSCVPKNLKGDHALTDLAGSILNLPHSVQACSKCGLSRAVTVASTAG